MILKGAMTRQGDDMCAHATWPAASGANAGGTAASGASADCAGTDWVFTKRNDRLQILLWKAWQAFYKQQVVAKMPGRERDLHLYHVAFGGASLLDVAEYEFVRAKPHFSSADHLWDSRPAVMVSV